MRRSGKGNIILEKVDLIFILGNHKIVQLGRDHLRSSSPTTLLKQSQLEQVKPRAVSSDLEYLHRWTLHNVSGQLVPVFDQSHRKKVFCCVQMEFYVFHFVLITFCPVSGHHGRKPRSFLCIVSHSVIVHKDKISP